MFDPMGSSKNEDGVGYSVERSEIIVREENFKGVPLEQFILLPHS
jgi:hypothetical protein